MGGEQGRGLQRPSSRLIYSGGCGSELLLFNALDSTSSHGVSAKAAYGRCSHARDVGMHVPIRMANAQCCIRCN